MQKLNNMTNLEMTAVEWLKEMLIDNKYLIRDAEHLFEQAKEMEKQQIIEAVNQTDFEDIDNYGICEPMTKGEQYYNEKFKN